MNGLILDTPPYTVYEHMALDELMCREKGVFALRFYNWACDAVSFGYAQFYGDVVKSLSGGPAAAHITRRPTGGGVVYHAEDLTFSCIFGADGKLSPRQLYARLHGAVHKAVAARGINCGFYAPPDERAADRGAKTAGVCFANPVPLDLIDERGGKMLGGAIRRFGETVLYQGSLQVDGARARACELRAAVLKSLAAEWNLKWACQTADGKLAQETGRLAAEKYGSREWIEKF